MRSIVEPSAGRSAAAGLVASIALVACGRLGYDPLGGAGGAGDGGAPGGVDAAPDGPLGEFAPPALAFEAADPADDPYLRSDLLELYVTIRLGGATESDIWVTTRAAVVDPWSAPTRVAELSTSGDESRNVLSGDGLSIFIASDVAGGAGGRDVYVAVRPTVGATWSAPVAVAELNTVSNDLPGSLFDGDRAMALFSGRNNPGEATQLFLTSRPDAASPWGPVEPIEELDSVAADRAPFVSADGRRIYFASERDGTRDLYLAERGDPGEPFGAPVPLSVLNSPATEDDPWLSPDERTIYFSSNRDGPRAIYTATR